MDVAAWLRDLGLERYAAAFLDAEITPEALPELTDADLRELGLPLGPRRVLLKAVRALVGPLPPPVGIKEEAALWRAPTESSPSPELPKGPNSTTSPRASAASTAASTWVRAHRARTVRW